MCWFRFVPTSWWRNSNPPPPPPNPCPGTLGHTAMLLSPGFDSDCHVQCLLNKTHPSQQSGCLLHVPHWLSAGLYLPPPNIVRQVYIGYSISLFTLQTKILVLGLITWVGLEINSCSDHGLGFRQISSVFGGLVRGVLILLSAVPLHSLCEHVLQPHFHLQRKIQA